MQPMRRVASILIAGSLVLLPTVALGHTDLASSDPADGSTVTEPPTEVVLTFEAEVDEAASFTVTDPSGAEVGTGSLDLDVPDRNVVRGDVEVAAPGEYTIAWSVVGDDGHDVTGEVTFTYDPEGEASTPDTALPDGATGSPVALVGVLLVVLAVLIPLRRVADVRG